MCWAPTRPNQLAQKAEGSAPSWIIGYGLQFLICNAGQKGVGVRIRLYCRQCSGRLCSVAL